VNNLIKKGHVHPLDAEDGTQAPFQKEKIVLSSNIVNWSHFQKWNFLNVLKEGNMKDV
jgi:hypothetical protein